MTSLSRCMLLLSLALATGCTEDTDDPSTVHDLRVLGLAVDSPELMAPSCEASPEALAVLGSEVAFRALLVDPREPARTLRYELFACAAAPEALCEPAEDKVLLAEGTTPPGELSLRIRPGATWLPDGTLLLERVREADPYKGLGGVRMPLVLHITGGADEVWASKLMVFNCPRVPGMEANQVPVLPGVHLQGDVWREEVIPVLRGPGPFQVELEDFSERVESYVVVGLDFQPVPLKESWKVAWHATLGELSPGETGGTEADGQPAGHDTEWRPPSGAVEQEVSFWAVVRDGRGGQSWLQRRARWIP
ncbi:hypothetical protein P2318_04025 [Myxococcaceae bacterium GXIMD 01537]